MVTTPIVRIHSTQLILMTPEISSAKIVERDENIEMDFFQPQRVLKSAAPIVRTVIDFIHFNAIHTKKNLYSLEALVSTNIST